MFADEYKAWGRLIVLRFDCDAVCIVLRMCPKL